MHWRSLLLTSIWLLIGVIGCNAPVQRVLPLPTVAPRPAVPPTARVFGVVPQLTTVGYEADEEFLDGADLILDRKPAERFKTTVGKTSAISGEIVLDFVDDEIELISAEFSVDITTLKTNRWQRDANIRNNWLRSKEYPRATFTATELRSMSRYTEGEPVTFQLLGDLQIRGVRRAVALEVTATHDGDMLTAATRLPLRMTDFGFNPPNIINAVVVEDEFVLFVELTARQR